jgi:hypothetical protein
MKRLFISKRGYIGLAPASAKVGDVIGVLYGSRVPHILRRLHDEGVKAKTGEFRCTLVGDAYVHGLMRGEAANLRAADPSLEYLFVIH